MNLFRPYRGNSAAERFAVRRVAILMAVRNGAKFLIPQIETVARQRIGQIDLWVSDDGSQDETREIIGGLAPDWQCGSVSLVDGPRAGFAENFRSLLTRADIEADYFAFCDQDDLWDEDKLSHAVEWLEKQPLDVPALFCSRTRLIGPTGEPMGSSRLFERPPSFRNALVQSIAGGNTMVMNRAARDMVREASRRTPFVSHDWWCYQIVTGVGGIVHYSPHSKIRYRQHSSNLVGENNSWRARIFRVQSTAKGRYRRWNTINIDALTTCQDMLTADARAALADFAAARKGNVVSRLLALRRSGVYRQTRLGQIGLYAACATGML